MCYIKFIEERSTMTSEITFEKIKELIIIDRNRLDDECQQHAEIFREVARKVAFALSARDAAKETVKKTDAMLAEKYRDLLASPTKKATEAMIEEKVLLDQEHYLAFKAMNEAKLEADLWEAEKEAFKEKSGMLKELCQLYLSGYFGEIIVKGENKDVQQKQYEVNRDKINLKRLEKENKNDSK